LHDEAIMMTLSCGEFLGKAGKSIQIYAARLSESRYAAGQHQPAHSHELPHIALTVAGSYTESAGKSVQIVSSGELTFYHPDVIHSERHWLGGTHFLIEIDPTKHEVMERLLPRFLKAPVKSGPALRKAWQLYTEFKQPDDFSPLSMEALTLELMVDSFRSESERIYGRQPIWLSTVFDMLRTRFVAPPRLSEIASEIRIHPVHLAKTFRRFTGITIGEYMRQLRVEFAREKLACSSEPLAQIALDAGFSDQMHFTKVFRRFTGITPLQFRKLSR
jgi:AraC family transcriptional regulator